MIVWRRYFLEMVKESWKFIPVFELDKQYMASNLGRIMRVKDGKIINGCKTKSGYIRIGLNRCHYYKHRLIALAWIPNPYNLPMINHKDEDKANNRFDNLEWCTAAYNVNYGSRTKRALETSKKNNLWQKHKDKFSIPVRCTETGEKYYSMNQASRETGIKDVNIGRACRKKCIAGGYHWEYVRGDYIGN